MKYRTLGNNKDVSILGFGCMRLPVIDGNYGQIDQEEAMKQLRYSIDHGINYIDTAYPYHEEASEGFVGEVLKDGYRDKVYIATKMPSWLIKSREDLDKYLDIQLERLQTDYIDYYLLHALNKDFWRNYKEHDVFDFIKKAKDSGKIRNIGFSFHDTYEVFEEIIQSYSWDFCQIQLNYFDEEYQAGVKGLKLAGSLGVGVVIMEPLRGGKLANHVPNEVLDLFGQSKEKHSPAGWALRYLWNYPEVSVILSGMNRMDHIDDNLSEANAAEVDMLSEKDKQIIQQVKRFYKSKIQVDCTNCKYCMPCPYGIDIPGNFSIYNNAHIFNDKEGHQKQYYRMLKPEQLAEACKQCGTCEPKCPQNIQIIDELEKVATYFKQS